MKSLTRLVQQPLIRKQNIELITTIRNLNVTVSDEEYDCKVYPTTQAAWHRDYKPGPYPITQAEREAAAKKYGLHPKDYQAYPDDGTGLGDYPMFEPVSMASRDPFEHYDFPELKRNWQEVLHADWDVYLEERVDCNQKFWTPIHWQFIIYVSFMTFLMSICLWDFHHGKKPIVMKTQYFGDGQKHYTFESP